ECISLSPDSYMTASSSNPVRHEPQQIVCRGPCRKSWPLTIHADVQSPCQESSVGQRAALLNYHPPNSFLSASITSCTNFFTSSFLSFRYWFQYGITDFSSQPQRSSNTVTSLPPIGSILPL